MSQPILAEHDGLALTDAHTVMRSADLAMYQAMGAGRGQVRVFHTDMSEQALRRLEMGTELPRIDLAHTLALHTVAEGIGSGRAVRTSGHNHPLRRKSR